MTLLEVAKALDAEIWPVPPMKFILTASIKSAR